MTSPARIEIPVSSGEDALAVATGLAAEAGIPLWEWMSDKVLVRSHPGLRHRQVFIADPSRGFRAEVDEGVAGDILLLWQNGIETVFSCQRSREGRQVVLRRTGGLDGAIALLPWATCGTSNLLGYAALTERCQGQWPDWPHIWERGAQ